MTALFEENFELYGGDISKMLDGVWAELDSSFGVGDAALEIPAWEEEDRYWLNISDRGDGCRCIFPAGAQTAIGAWGHFYFPSLPTQNNYGYLFQFRDGSNANVFGLAIQSDGTLAVHGTNEDTPVATSAGPVFQAATNYLVQVQATPSTGAIAVRVGQSPTNMVTVINIASGSGIGSNSVVGYGHYQNDSATGPYAPLWVKASCAYSLSGTYNSNWPSISGIKTLLIDEDTATNNLTPRPRNHFDKPVLFVDRAGDVTSGVTVESHSTEFDFGTGDYTLEGWVRFRRLPESGETFNLWGAWNEVRDRRSYRLAFKASDVDGGGLQFEYSTDGTGATVATVHDINWEPQIGVWYHVAVARDSSTNDNRLFIDGVQQGTDQTDSATYYTTANDYFCIGNITDGNTTPASGDDAFDGHMQDIRVTKGIVRYTANFTPPSTFFPTASPADPDFSSVSLLTQLDDPTLAEPADQSSNTFTLQQQGSADVVDYADTVAAFQAAGTNSPLDDRYLESGLPKAQGILTLAANASDGDTVTIDTDTFTFKTTLTPTAGEILIGATANDSLSNLAAAINGGAGAGTLYASGTTTTGNYTAENATPAVNQMTATAVLGGTGGNSIATTETGSNMSWGGSTMSGGAALPGASEFGIQSLPPDATGVRWIAIRHRSYVPEGSATIATKLDVNGSESSASSSGMTADPQYYTQRIEEDPDTTAALTVSSIENAKIKIERTA
jgi:hypothetical protein